MTATTLAELEAARVARYALSPDQLKAWRTRMHFSTAGAAVVLGVSPRSYEAWESGRRSVSLTACILAARLEKHGLPDLLAAERRLLEPARPLARRPDACAAP